MTDAGKTSQARIGNGLFFLTSSTKTEQIGFGGRSDLEPSKNSFKGSKMNDKELLIRELWRGIEEIKEAYRASLASSEFFTQWAYLRLKESGEDWE